MDGFTRRNELRDEGGMPGLDGLAGDADTCNWNRKTITQADDEDICHTFNHSLSLMRSRPGRPNICGAKSVLKRQVHSAAAHALLSLDLGLTSSFLGTSDWLQSV